MIKVAMFDTKPYDQQSFAALILNTPYQFTYIEARLTLQTAPLAKGCQAVCAFVNDQLDHDVILALEEIGIEVIVLRCAGYSNVDFKTAYQRINVLRVPAYSPYAVAEHALALLLAVNRHLPRAYNRTRDFNFSLNGLTGTDLDGKKAGVIGAGKIGRAFMANCEGLGMEVSAYDLFPPANSTNN